MWGVRVNAFQAEAWTTNLGMREGRFVVPPSGGMEGRVERRNGLKGLSI